MTQHLTKPPTPRGKPIRLHPTVDILRTERYAQRMTVADLSKLTGYSDKAINQWEQGRVNPKLWHLHDWAQALGYEVKVERRK